MDNGVVVSDKVLGILEGPVWCPDGTLVLVSVSHGYVSRIWPDSGDAETIADTGGGANGAVLGSDGSIVIAQDGGLDLHAMDPKRYPETRFTRPGLQRVFPDGRVEYLTAEPMQFPNDLCVAPDGTIYFTDMAPLTAAPGAADASGPLGRIMAYRTDGTVEVIAQGFHAPNGIAVDLDDSSLIVVVSPPHDGPPSPPPPRPEPGQQPDYHAMLADKRDALVRLADMGRGERTWHTQNLPIGDGICFDVDGRVYVAAGPYGVKVFEDGAEVDRLEVEGVCLFHNCCFGGDDLRTMYATDSAGHRVFAWEGMATPGHPLHVWPAP